jgi:hypothetical protein
MYLSETQEMLVVLGITVLDDMTVVSPILLWPMIQMGVALFAACLPTTSNLPWRSLVVSKKK